MHERDRNHQLKREKKKCFVSLIFQFNLIILLNLKKFINSGCKLYFFKT